jgi:hypothetical protein
MSYTTLFKVPASGPIDEIAEFKNSHRFGPFVWDMLAKAHLNADYATLSWDKQMQRVWDLAHVETVPTFERITLMSTFDHVMVKQADISKVIEAFKAFSEKYDTGAHGSLWEQVPFLTKMVEDKTCYAICWTQTSITDPWWVSEGDDVRLYDISRDNDRHWFMFATPDAAAGTGDAPR